MPSSSRLADAANITPYLTHRINHHAYPTLVPPEHAGRTRKVKTKKPRPRQERRPDDEPRFNVGSPRPRLQPANGRGRRPSRVNMHQGRRDDNHDGVSTSNLYDEPKFTHIEMKTFQIILRPHFWKPSLHRSLLYRALCGQPLQCRGRMQVSPPHLPHHLQGPRLPEN